MTRVVFMGTPRFALPTLDALLATPNIEVVGVMTQPDRPCGRGRKIQSPPVKERVRDQEIPILQAPRVRDDPAVPTFLESTRPDVGVVVAFGQWLPGPVFDFPPHGTLNLHASLLPRYRGAAPIARAVLEGEEVTGVTIMKIEKRLDAGPILGQEEMAIGPDTTTGELENLMAGRGASLLLRLLPAYLEGRLIPSPQEESQASYAPVIEKAEALLDWTMPARRIHDRVRAFNPSPVARTVFRGQPLRVWRTGLTEPGPSNRGEGPGTLVRIPGGRVGVLCGDCGVLELIRVQPANRRKMGGVEFANGSRLRPGEVVGNPSS